MLDRAKGVSSAIEAPATNLTMGSGILALLAVVGTAVTPVFDTVFPAGASSGIRAAVLIAIFAAWAVVAAADLITRAIVKVATSQTQWVISPVDLATTVKRLEGADDPGWTVAAVRFQLSSPDKTSYLLVKAGKTPAWVEHENVEFA